MINARSATALSGPNRVSIEDDTAIADDRTWFMRHSDRLFRGRRLYPDEWRHTGWLPADVAAGFVIVCRADAAYWQPGDPAFVRMPILIERAGDNFELPDDETFLSTLAFTLTQQMQRRSVN